MAIKLSNAFITKLQMTSGDLNIFEDFDGTAAIISGSDLGGGGSSYELLIKYDASDASSYGGTGTTWTDISGYPKVLGGPSTDATLEAGSGTITYSDSNPDYFDLSGGTNTRISVPDSEITSLSTSTSKAYSAWIKADAVGFVSFSTTIFSKQSGNPAGDGFWVGINSSNQLGARVTSDNGSTTKYISGIGATISTGTWYLVTLLAQVSSTADTFKLFINSTEVGSTTGGGSSVNDTNNLYIGNYHTGLQSATSFNGQVSQFYLHSGFTASDVTTLFDNTKSAFGY